MVSDEEGPPLARGFVQYNLCCILPQSAIVQAGGTCVLNGLFVMEKGELHQGVHVHRLIVNLIPTNTLFLRVTGGVETLPLRLIVNLSPTNTLLLPVERGVETLPLLPHMNALEPASCAPKFCQWVSLTPSVLLGIYTRTCSEKCKVISVAL